MIAEKDEYTPTPVVSHAMLTYNRGRKTGLADGVVITPSHNPPHDGGFKYTPPNGGPAEHVVTDWIEAKANGLLENGLRGVKRISFEKALRASTTHRHDYLKAYISDLGSVIDMDAIRGAKISLGVDPLGGAGVHYWAPMAERYGLNLTVVTEAVDPTFRFMTADGDGQIRMDPSSPYAMQRLIDLKDRFEIALACDTDHDRHGIVRSSRRASVERIIFSTSWRKRRQSSRMLWRRPRSSRGFRPRQIWRRNYEQTNRCQPPDIQSSGHGSRGIRFPGRAGPGYALVVESCYRQNVAAA
jgi:alpha-D-glucose phosphate-specific phosphoglucomutase